MHARMHARVSCAGTIYAFLTCWTFARYCWTRLLFCEATAGVFFISPGTENLVRAFGSGRVTGAIVAWPALVDSVAGLQVPSSASAQTGMRA